jgi:hypothetical protein
MFYDKFFISILKNYFLSKLTIDNFLYFFDLAKDNIDASRFIKDNIEAIEIVLKCFIKVGALVFSFLMLLFEWAIVIVRILFEKVLPKLFSLFEILKYCFFVKNDQFEMEKNIERLKKRRECIILRFII